MPNVGLQEVAGDYYVDLPVDNLQVNNEAKIAALLLGGAPAAGETPVSSALVLGGGTSSDPMVSDVANKNFIEFRCSTTATTAGSDVRGLYLRTLFDGATTGGGDCARIFSTVNAACGTVHGAHISLSFGASGSVSGQGIACRTTLHVAAGTQTGTVAPLQSEIWLDAATSAIAAAHSYLRCVTGGDATLAAGIKYLMDLDLAAAQVVAASSAVDKLVTTGCADSTSDVEIKININGTDYWLLATATAPAP